MLRDSKFRREGVWVWSPTKWKNTKKKTWVEHELRSAPGRVVNK